MQEIMIIVIIKKYIKLKIQARIFIEILKNIKAQHFMLSHRNPFDNSKDSVIRLLDGIYAKRKSGEPYISGIDGE